MIRASARAEGKRGAMAIQQQRPYVVPLATATRVIQGTNMKECAMFVETFARPDLITLPAYEADE